MERHPKAYHSEADRHEGRINGLSCKLTFYKPYFVIFLSRANLCPNFAILVEFYKLLITNLL